VSIRVPKLVLVTAALVLLGLLAFFNYLSIGIHPIQTADKHIGQPAESSDDGLSTDPQELLDEADRLFWLNNGPKAATFYAKAERLFAAKGDGRNELYAKVGRLRSEAETMSFVDLSRILNEQLQNPLVQNDSKLRLWCLIAKGYTDIEIDYRAAKSDWLEAQDIAKRLGEQRWVTRASGELGLIAFLEGNPGTAARLLGGALLSTMATGDTGGQVRFLELLGNGFEEVNRHAEALNFFARAIKLAEAVPDCGVPFMGYEGKAQALVALGRTEEAKAVLQGALTKARAQEKRGHEAQLLILLGKVDAQTGNREQALTYLEDAGQFATRFGYYRMEADAMFELATLYRDGGDLAMADARATQGLTASQQVGDRYYVPRDLTMLADLKTRRGRFAEASALYEEAEDVIEGMLISADEPYWNSSAAAAMSQTYLEHFELLTKTGDTPGAFTVLERVRGRTLAAALKGRKEQPSAESKQAVTLESDVAGLQVRVMQTGSAPEREQLLDNISEDERRLGLAWTEEDSRNQHLPLQPTPLTKVESDLHPDEALLEYVLDEPTSFCISVTRQGARVQTLPMGRKELEKLVQQFDDEVRAEGAGIEISTRLFQVLIAPIPEAKTTTKFIIAPDGILNLLPFEALRDNQGEYLLKSRVISYVPSGTVLDVLRGASKNEKAPLPFLGVADVAYENQGGAGRMMPTPGTIRGRLLRGMADLFGIQLHDLPGTRKEVEHIGKIVGPGAVILLGKDATETAFKRQPLYQFRVLHLAVHGFADAQYPERSALVLGTDRGSGDDGLLQVREITRLRLNAELTTLSSCDTGVGKLQGQEGVSNLVEAFLVAGSRSVVASLWSTEDTFTSVLMDRFYERLDQGEDTRSALRDAKLELLAKYGDHLSPFYWAAFIPVGDASSPVGIRQQ
jgi:CHAT domain-containing protein